MRQHGLLFWLSPQLPISDGDAMENPERELTSRTPKASTQREAKSGSENLWSVTCTPRLLKNLISALSIGPLANVKWFR